MRRLAPLALVLAACGGSSLPAPKEAPTPAPAAAPTEVAAPTPDTAEVGPWGAPVESPDQVAQVRAYLTALAEGRGPDVSGPVIAIGPGLWGEIGDSSDFDGRGIPIHNHIPVGGEQIILDGHAFRNEEMAIVTTSKTFVALGKKFAAGEIRAATADERAAIYAVISWEIAGQPVTVSHVDGATLIFQLDDAGIVVLLDLVEPIQRVLSGE